jgi:subtilisin family serine protease
MPEDELYYVVGGQQVTLRKVATALLAVAGKQTSTLAAGARLARSSRLGLDAGFRERLLLRGDPAKLAEVARYADIARTRSVFLDPDGLELALTDQVIVSFDGAMSAADRQRLVRDTGATIVAERGDHTVLHVVDPDPDAPLHTANRLTAADGVEYAEPDAVQKAAFQGTGTAQVTDAGFAAQWHLSNDGRAGGVAGADIRAVGAWQATQGDPAVRIVVHDSGVDVDHPDLVANIAPGWDFDNDDPDASNDEEAHGTACAGVIAAALNGVGVVGIAPRCRIVPLRAAGAHSWTEWAQTFHWARERGDVISCSWTLSPNETLTRAIRTAAREGRGGKGIPCFFASGNDGNGKPAGFPASLPEVIGVGACSNSDRLATYSQIGPGVDFLAPSSGGRAGTLRIQTTDVAGEGGYSPDDYCHADDPSGFGGTSSATPLAAGVGALLLSLDPDLSAEDVRQVMRATARKVDIEAAAYDSGGFSPTHGFGCVDAAAAVQRVQNRLRVVEAPSKPRRGDGRDVTRATTTARAAGPAAAPVDAVGTDLGATAT